MKIYINGHGFHYEIENIIRVFFQNERLEVIRDSTELSPPCAVTEITRTNDGVRLNAQLIIDSYNKSLSEKLSITTPENELERTLAVLLFKIMSVYTGYTPPWGILTGVRPIKLLRSLTEELGEEKAAEYFANKCMVSDDKIALAIRTEKNESKIIKESLKEAFSLYISIPFCPSRCAYCSFVSQSVDKSFHLIDRYIENLCKEIFLTAEKADALGLKLFSVYIGGGTPTVLSAVQLETVLTAVKSAFGIDVQTEFTVEAGRPDTINGEKLLAMKDAGVNRISINPQTMNDSVLAAIGRKHSAAETISAFKLAREHGFNSINADVIAGLPGESPQSFANTVKTLCELSAESVTLHTLAVKRSARLNSEGIRLNESSKELVSSMLRFAENELDSRGYHPYYLYRQSKMAGNFENVGWAKDGQDCRYNVYVMDETHTVLACGAGGVTKLKEHGRNNLVRIFNFKHPYEYISRFDEMLLRKSEIDSFYAMYPLK